MVTRCGLGSNTESAGDEVMLLFVQDADGASLNENFLTLVGISEDNFGFLDCPQLHLRTERGSPAAFDASRSSEVISVRPASCCRFRPGDLTLSSGRHDQGVGARTWSAFQSISTLPSGLIGCTHTWSAPAS